MDDQMKRDDEYWLPDDVWWLILSFIPAEEQLLQMPCVSKAWASLVAANMDVLDLIDSYAYRNHKGPYLHDALFERVPNLRTLSLNYPDKVTSVGLSWMTGLTKLHLFGLTKLTTRALLHLTGLVHLSIDNNYELPVAHNLTSLSMDGNWLVSRETLQCFTALRSLELGATGSITSTDVVFFTDLDSLSLNIPDVYDDTLKGLTNLTKLELREMSPFLTDAAIIPLTKLKTLTLCDASPSFTGSCLIHLPALTSLRAWDEHLHALVALSQLTTLEKLYWRESHHAELVMLTRLRTLHIYRSFHVTEELFTTLPNLRNLWAYNLSLDSSVIADDLSRLTKLGTNTSYYRPSEFCKEGFSLDDVHV